MNERILKFEDVGGWLIMTKSVVLSKDEVWCPSGKKPNKDVDYGSASKMFSLLLNFAPYFVDNCICVEKGIFSFVWHANREEVIKIINDSGFANIEDKGETYSIRFNVKAIEDVFGFKISDLINSINERKRETMNDDLRSELKEAIQKAWDKNPDISLSEDDVRYALHEAWKDMVEPEADPEEYITDADIKYGEVVEEAIKTLTQHELFEYTKCIGDSWNGQKTVHSNNKKIEKLLNKIKPIIEEIRKDLL